MQGNFRRDKPEPQKAMGRQRMQDHGSPDGRQLSQGGVAGAIASVWKQLRQQMMQRQFLGENTSTIVRKNGAWCK